MSYDDTEKLLGEAPLPGNPVHPSLVVLAGTAKGQSFRLDLVETIVGRADDAHIVFPDRGISRHHAKFTRSPDGNVVLTDLGSTNGTFVAERKVDSVLLQGGERIRLGAAVRLKFDFRDANEEQLLEAATRDELTGVFNRNYFKERLRVEWARATRHRTPLSLVFIDADHFKSINDTHGHLAGDAVLRELAARMTGLSREEDLVARYGGEEFVMLLPETDPLGAARLAERVRQLVAESPFPAPSPTGPVELSVTVSLGVAWLVDGLAEEELLARADQALYAAKQAGRNRVISHHE